MSCSTLNQQTGNINVTVGALPEGFCPSSMQDLLAAFGARIIVTLNQATTPLASGSIEPTSNVGPWFKNCEELFVFDDGLAKYVPLFQGFNNFTVFDADNSFTVPDNIYKVKVEAWGAGGGGGNKSGGSEGGAGGGSGGYGLKVFAVAPSQNFAVVVGAAGVNGSPGTNGTASTVLTLSAGGGSGGASGAPSAAGGSGGVVTGADIAINGGSGWSADNNTSGDIGGSGAASPKGGSGGNSSTIAAQLIGVAPGGGGAGGANAFTTSGGMGAKGRVIIYW